jgi:hypothetical protein
MSQNPERPPYRMAIVDRASTPGFPFECVFKCDSYADARAVCDFVIRGRPADETTAVDRRCICDVGRVYPGKHRSGCPAESEEASR